MGAKDEKTLLENFEIDHVAWRKKFFLDFYSGRSRRHTVDLEPFIIFEPGLFMGHIEGTTDN